MINTTRKLKDASYVAVMPDVHLANGFCVGTVLATKRVIYPSAVGSDIGCGMLAVPFRTQAKHLDASLARQLLRVLPELVPAKRQRHAALTLNEDRPRLSATSLNRCLYTTGLKQLGTLGSGNHFLELQRDEKTDQLWLMLHSGSRGLGQAISTHHLGQIANKSVGRPYLEAAAPEGMAYLQDVRIAQAYAMLNRVVMARAVAFALHELAGIATDWTRVIHTDHNHVRQEIVQGQNYWIHRKGAAPAFALQPSVIPGSMGTASYHVVGRGFEKSLRSSSHGAGRRMDRTTARRLHTPSKLKQSMQGIWFNEAAASALTDEAPSAYKNIDRVIEQQRSQVHALRRLMPVLNYKGR